MTHAADARLRPAATADYRAPSEPRRRGILLAVVGLVIALVAFVGNLVATGQSGTDQASTLAWTFGVTTTGFAVIKTAIAVVLWGILAKLWLRAGSIEATLPNLVGTPGVDATAEGDIDTPYGKVRVTAKATKQLPIHTMAKHMFRPMLAMGLMLVVVGLIVSFVWAGAIPNTATAAWTQGLQFLGEAMLLSRNRFPPGNHPLGDKDRRRRSPRRSGSQGVHTEVAYDGQGVRGVDDARPHGRRRPVRRIRCSRRK